MSAEPPSQEPLILISPEVFEGKWANAAQLQRSPHEFTLDFLRFGPQGQQASVVARVSFSEALLGELTELFRVHWEAYTEQAGIPPQTGLPPEGDD